MELKFVYTKSRAQFGRPCHFSDSKGKINVSIDSDPMWTDDFFIPKYRDRSVQCVQEMSEHSVETQVTSTHDKSVNHSEGGWPRDISHDDMDQKYRFRKKIEKDENFVNCVTYLGEAMVHCLQQNNAVNIYGNYFDELDIIASEEAPKALLLNTFSAHRTEGEVQVIPKSAVYVSWFPECPDRFASAHCTLKFGKPLLDGKNNESYVWNFHNSIDPEMVLRPSSPVVCLEHNPRDTHVLIGGCYNGQLAFWDIRKNESPISVSETADSHQDVAWKVKWIQCKTGTEFFSASTDGRVMWWDTRKLTKPLESVILDPTRKQDILDAEGAYALDYDASIPTKFMVGTEQGRVFSCNKKGKKSDDKISYIYDGQNGPIYAVQRNPFFLNKFLTVSDWSMRIWSEEIKDWSIMSTAFSKSNYTDGCWSPVRPGVFMASKHDGTIEVWDLVFRQAQPTIMIKVTDQPLYCIRPEANGRLIATGLKDGSISVLALPEGLYTQTRKEKSLVAAIFDRETRRERIIETRAKEVKLKLKQQIEIDISEKSASQSEATVNKKREEILGEIETSFFEYLDEMKELQQKKQQEYKSSDPKSPSVFSSDSSDSLTRSPKKDDICDSDDERSGNEPKVSRLQSCRGFCK